MFYSIKSKLILTLVSLLGIIAIFIFLYFPAQYEQMQMEALVSNSSSLNKLISYSLSPALFFEDVENINEVISGAKRNKKITYLVVFNQEELIAHYNYDLAAKVNFSHLHNFIDEENQILKTIEPVKHNKNIIGYLYAGYSLAEINKQINTSRFIIALISIILFLIGSLIVYSISKYSLRTLSRIIGTAKKISSGDTSTRAAETNDEIGEVAKVFNLMMDDLETSEQKLKKWNLQLEEQVKKRTIDLENEIEERKKTEIELIKAKETAEEMNRLKTNFLANMSHEIRTPLVGILGYSDIIQQDSEDPEIIEMGAVIKKSGTRLLNTLNQILDLTKMESERENINLKRTNIVELVNESVDLFKMAASEKGLQLLFEQPENEIYTFVEQDLFISLMNNLLNNAIKYTSKGRVSVELKRAQDNVLIEVKDTGTGIPENMLETIFEPFRQVSEGFDRRFEGTGLGLTLTTKYAEIMNGRIEVESVFKGGSTFRVILPEAPKNGTAEKLNDVFDTERKTYDYSNKIKILLVEDDEVNTKAIKLFLKDKFELDAVNNFKEAVKLIDLYDYDIFLLDIELKGEFTGIDLIHKIRKSKNNVHKPAVAVTAFAMPDEMKSFLEQGFTHSLTKPFYRKDLLDLLNEITSHSWSELKLIPEK